MISDPVCIRVKGQWACFTRPEFHDRKSKLSGYRTVSNKGNIRSYFDETHGKTSMR